MKFSQSLDLALHALWYMASQPQEEPVMIKDIARCMNASESYFARVMLWLAKAGLLKSIRGKKGGFVFKKSPDRITIADVVLAIDENAGTFDCSWDERECSHHKSCELENLFEEAQEQMLNVLRRMTIADLAKNHRERFHQPMDSSANSKQTTQITTVQNNEQ